MRIERLGIGELREQMPDVLDKVREKGQRFVIQTYKRDRAAIVSLEDLERLEKLDAAKKKREKVGQ